MEVPAAPKAKWLGAAATRPIKVIGTKNIRSGLSRLSHKLISNRIIVMLVKSSRLRRASQAAL
jgi:hypothetical protein